MMKQIRKLYPNYYKVLFIYFNKQEKKTFILLFTIMCATGGLVFISLSTNIFISLAQILLAAANVFILANVLSNLSREYNKRVMRDLYAINITTYTKAFQKRLMEVLFIKNLIVHYAKYEDLLADYDEEQQAQRVNVRKKFIVFLSVVCSFIAFIGSFLLEGATLKAKVQYLVLASVFILLPIIFIYLQFSPIVKDFFEKRYKKDRAIIEIVEKLKKIISQFPAKYIAANDLKTLILASGFIDEMFVHIVKSAKHQG